MNAYRVDKDRGEDVDKIGGCPRVLVVEQRGARHGINVWPPRQNIRARPHPRPSRTPSLALQPPFGVHHLDRHVHPKIVTDLFYVNEHPDLGNSVLGV